jgi:hypothetical protein
MSKFLLILDSLYDLRFFYCHLDTSKNQFSSLSIYLGNFQARLVYVTGYFKTYQGIRTFNPKTLEAISWKSLWTA